MSVSQYLTTSRSKFLVYNKISPLEMFLPTSKCSLSPVLPFISMEELLSGQNSLDTLMCYCLMVAVRVPGPAIELLPQTCNM